MESSAAKRRKTSPAAPPNIVAQIQAQPRSTGPPDPSPESATGPKRNLSSFASPTKSSLARYNPEILKRRAASSRGLDREENHALPLASRPGSRDSQDSVSAALASQLERHSELDSATARATADGVHGEQTANSTTRASTSPKTGGRTNPKRVVSGMAARPRRSPTKPNPRPLPPPGPDDDEDVLNPPSRPALYRRAPGVLPTAVEPEPELPPTPEHPDPVVSTPPTGIHNTPSRKPKRSRAVAEKIRSSPSKLQSNGEPRVVRRGKAAIAFDPSFLRLPDQTSSITSGHQAQISNPRGLEPVDGGREKRNRRDTLRAEIKQLEADLDVASKENERIREARLSRVGGAPVPVPVPRNKEEVLEVLRRHVLPPDAGPQKDSTTERLNAALTPRAFLPFNKLTSSFPTIFPRDANDGGDRPPPASHHPIAMSAAEELPYLQVFAPLSFTSHVELLPRDNSDEPLLQKHTITATSTVPTGLFAATISMSVDTKSLAITSLSVPSLDPASAPELRPFIARITGQDASRSSTTGTTSSAACRALNNNASLLGWAMGEWLRVALRRAKFWCVAEREFGSRDALVESVARLRSGRKWRGKRKVVGGGDDAAAEEDGRGDGGGEEGGEEGGGASMDVAGGVFARADLLPHMGRTSLDVQIPCLAGSGPGDGPSLRVQWRIGFDWTGEAQSEIGVLVGVAGKWQKQDDRGSLSSGLPDLFDKLVQGNEDPLTAVRAVVSLLAGEQR